MNTGVNQDISQQLIERVRTARHENQPLAIVGHGSKHFVGGQSHGQPLPTVEHSGVIDYEPGDLVMTARSGTPLVAIEKLLADQGQCLGFEPPRFRVNGEPAGTIGGAVAAGLSGPRRPWAGATRDFVLGVTLVNGLAQRLHFGGQLVKNVAGFDLPRMLTGSMGTLGLLLDISFRVMPIRPQQLTLQLELAPVDALAKMIQWQRLPLPLSGLVYHQGVLSVRLAGTLEGVESARKQIGGDALNNAAQWWDGLRDQSWSWFTDDGAVLRISCPAAAQLADCDGDWILDWGGAQRWYRGETSVDQLQILAQKLDGHLSRFRGGNRQLPIALPNVQLARIHQQLKQAFDPDGVFDGDRLLRSPAVQAGRLAN